VPGDVSGEKAPGLAKRLRQFNDWRMADPDVAETARIVLMNSGSSSIAQLAVDNPEMFDGLYDAAEQMVGDHLRVERL